MVGGLPIKYTPIWLKYTPIWMWLQTGLVRTKSNKRERTLQVSDAFEALRVDGRSSHSTHRLIDEGVAGRGLDIGCTAFASCYY